MDEDKYDVAARIQRELDEHLRRIARAIMLEQALRAEVRDSPSVPTSPIIPPASSRFKLRRSAL